MARVTSGLGFKDTQAVHDRLGTWLWHQQDLGSHPGSATAGRVTGLFTSLCVSVSSSVNGDQNAACEDELGNPCPERSQHLLNASWVLVLRASSYHGVIITSTIPGHLYAWLPLLPQQEVWWGSLPSSLRWGPWHLEDPGSDSECHTSQIFLQRFVSFSGKWAWGMLFVAGLVLVSRAF